MTFFSNILIEYLLKVYMTDFCYLLDQDVHYILIWTSNKFFYINIDFPSQDFSHLNCAILLLAILHLHVAKGEKGRSGKEIIVGLIGRLF